MLRVIKIIFRYLEILFLALLALSKYLTMDDSQLNAIPGVPFNAPTRQFLAVLLIIVVLIIIFRKWIKAQVNAFDIIVALSFGILIFPETFSLLWYTEIGMGDYLHGVIVYGAWTTLVFREIIRYIGIPPKILLMIAVPVMVVTFVTYKLLMPTSFWEMPPGAIDKISLYVQIIGLFCFGAAVLTTVTVINLIEDKWVQPVGEKRAA